MVKKKELRIWGQASFSTTLLAMLVSLQPLPAASAMDNWIVDGEHGVLTVHGMLSEGACHLDMTSSFQQVSLGATAFSTLTTPGSEGQQVPFQVKLTDCSRSGGDQSDQYHGTTTWDSIQPVVTLSFTGVSDPDMPYLLKVTGVSGIGLKLSDPQGRIVRPGERGQPLIITPGDNEVEYTVTPVRTPAPLGRGAFRAVSNFEVSYD
ncbi:type 1 fimbrial protein [Citrobacter braakii]|nr:type 1 fimbrial protein [Citrobacter braakii]